MMSPLSVAQFLPADSQAFDLVVFDEASQITVPDAIGAMARGKRGIVVGDPKQMPPTRFFERGAEDDENEEVRDLERILDEALAARVPHHRLTGHHRSRHESLICFSNHTYYEGALVTYPSRGWTVRTQIGVSRFRIDLGVVHPDAPGRFLAGIECDGATYHSSPSARDRDRVRHIILEQLGWRLIRIWSTDFFLDPAASIEALDARLRALVEADRAAAAEGSPVDQAELPATATWETDSDASPDGDDAELDNDELDGEGQVDESDADVCVPGSTPPASAESVAAGVVARMPQLPGLEDPLASSCDPGRFFDANYGPTLRSMAAAMIDAEGPITFKRLSDRIARAHGFQRTGKAISSTLWAACRRLRRHVATPDGHKVFWPDGTTPATVMPFRGLTINGERREWREVPHPEKLGLVQEVFNRGSRDLPRSVAEAIGMGRVTTQFRGEIQELVRHLGHK
jgi:very-short-patch-repair endonuclease